MVSSPINDVWRVFHEQRKQFGSREGWEGVGFQYALLVLVGGVSSCPDVVVIEFDYVVHKTTLRGFLVVTGLLIEFYRRSRRVTLEIAPAELVHHDVSRAY
ncbi:hypothetical protein Q1695_004018 [Nippostrongylus brasiliensis]|nr:hypothetical protein Q1695_004018 [Nippostrongylus brasiliensis]